MPSKGAVAAVADAADVSLVGVGAGGFLPHPLSSSEAETARRKMLRMVKSGCLWN